MVALLFTAIFIIGLLVALYFWAPRSNSLQGAALPTPREPRGLFDNGFHPDVSSLNATAVAGNNAATIDSMRQRAQNGDKTVLSEAFQGGDHNCYDALLNELVAAAQDDASLRELVSYVQAAQLPVSTKLAEAYVASWKRSPGRSSTATMLHVVALADDPNLFGDAMETALSFWQNGLLKNVTSNELRTLFDSQFWILSADTRASGAGFILKNTLARVRRQLETATNV